MELEHSQNGPIPLAGLYLSACAAAPSDGRTPPSGCSSPRLRPCTRCHSDSRSCRRLGDRRETTARSLETPHLLNLAKAKQITVTQGPNAVKRRLLLKGIPNVVPNSSKGTAIPLKSAPQTLPRGKHNDSPVVLVHSSCPPAPSRFAALFLHALQITLESNTVILRNRINKSFFGHQS